MDNEKPKRRPRHMNGTRVSGKETLTCEECRKRKVSCGGVWRFHSQHAKYILQCRTCRLKRRACPFRRFEEEEEEEGPQMVLRSRGQKAAQKKHERQESPIDISDSSDSDSERKVAGPSSRPEKRPKLEAKSGKDWDALEETLLAARTRKVEIQTRAEIELAKVDAIIEETQRKVKK